MSGCLGELVERTPETNASQTDLQPPPRAKRPESLTSREQEILELIWSRLQKQRGRATA